MPVSFQYHYADDTEGEPVKLARIDDEMCADLGIVPHPDKFCDAYHALMFMGFSILVQTGGTHVTREGLDAYWRTRNATGTALEDAEDLYLYSLACKYLAGGKYTYSAWR